MNALIVTGRTTAKVVGKVEPHLCEQCGEDMGYEWLLGAVCGRCCRANHRKVTRR